MCETTVFNIIGWIVTIYLNYKLAKQHQDQIGKQIKEQIKQVRLGKENFREGAKEITRKTLEGNNYEIHRENEAFGVVNRIFAKKLKGEEKKFKSEDNGSLKKKRTVVNKK